MNSTDKVNKCRTLVNCLIPALILLARPGAASASETKLPPTEQKAPVTKSSGWAQEKSEAEKLIQLKESSGSVFLAAKLLSGDGDIHKARSLLRKAAGELSGSKVAQSGPAMHEQIGLLCNDFAFMQSLESEVVKLASREQQNLFRLQHLKDVASDYDILITAAEKQLGQTDQQVKILKQLQSTLHASTRANEHTKETQGSRPGN